MVQQKRPPRPQSHRLVAKKAANNGQNASSSHSGSKQIANIGHLGGS